MTTINTVIFDLDDTLCDDTASAEVSALFVAQDIAPRYGIEVDDLVQMYHQVANDFWQNLHPSDFASAQQSIRARCWGLTLREFGISGRDVAGWCSFVHEDQRERHLHLFPGVTTMLANLRKQGVKLGLLTNGFAQTHRSKIRKLGLEDSFDGIFLADEVGMVKPDPEIFLHACKQLGTVAAQAAMVGDRYERDIGGAHIAGLTTVWVDIGRDILPDNSPPPDATVTLVSDTPAALGLFATS